jgi:hypothetical protein
MGHTLNFGLTTNMKGATKDSLRVAIGASGAPTLTEDCGAGLIASVTLGTAGRYTFQMAKPYPPKLVTCKPQLAGVSATDPVVVARYEAGSYNATAGTFIVQCVNLPTSTTAAAANPASGSELHVDLVTRRYTANP